MFAKYAAAVWWTLGLSYPVGLALAIVVWLDEPRLGLDVGHSVAGDAVVQHVRPGSPAWDAGVREGDVLLEIDGVAVDDVTWSRRRDSGAEFRVLSRQSGGTVAEIRGSAPRPSSSVIASLWAISAVFAITSFFVFFRSNRSTGILALALFLMTSASVTALAPATARSQPLADLVVPPLLHWASASFFVFFYTFRRDRADNSPVRRAVIACAVISALAANIIWIWSVEAAPSLFEAARRLTFAYVGAGALAGTFLLVRAYFSDRSAVSREQTRIMLMGILTAVMPAVLLSVAPGALGLPFLVRPEVSVLALVLVPLSFAYAILRHHFMGIRRLVHRGAAYALISFSIFCIYGFLVFALGTLGGPQVGRSPVLHVMLLGVLFVAVPFISGTRRLAFATVDRLLYREYVNYAELGRRVSIAAAHAQRIDDLSSTVLGVLVSELRLSFASFVGMSRDVFRVKASAGAMPEGLTRAMARELAHDRQGRALSKVMALPEGGEAALVGLTRESGGMWVLCLGPKPTQEPFYPQDMDLAESIVGPIATMVEKLELLEELQRKAAELRDLNRRLVQAQELERSRIAAYLHDEPLQQITSLVWKYSQPEISPALHEDLQWIAQDLRNFTARLQPALLEDLGLVRALEWLGSEMGAASGIETVFEFRGMERDQRRDPDIELGLYRIAQEALTNCQKHSRAKKIWVSLTVEQDLVTLVVEDDGVGLRNSTNARSTTRLGLIGMRERAEQLGGWVQVLPRGPSGTRVVASVPTNWTDGVSGTASQGVNVP